MEYRPRRNVRPPHSLNPQIRTEATEWLLRFSEGEVDAAAREEFNDWLRISPEHVRAYLRVSAFWQEAGHLDGKEGPRDVAALVNQAKKEANIFPLAFGPHNTDEVAGRTVSSAASATTPSLFQGSRRFAAIAATIVAMVGATIAYQHLTRGIYETQIGEQRTINLPDGSTLILNADSRVRVRYSDTERTVDLEEGQALFKVAKNPARPFIVRSGDASVRAVGTQFDVYRKATGTTVTVVEGKVAVTSEMVKRAGKVDADRANGHAPVVEDPGSLAPDSITSDHVKPLAIKSSAPVFLIAGEQLTIPKIAMTLANGTDPGDMVLAPAVRPVKVEETTAWTVGLLVFDGVPLADVVQEFNRQNVKPLVIESDSELAQLRISGSFPSNGSERITRFLEERFGVVVHETRDDIRLSRR